MFIYRRFGSDDSFWVEQRSFTRYKTFKRFWTLKEINARHHNGGSGEYNKGNNKVRNIPGTIFISSVFKNCVYLPEVENVFLLKVLVGFKIFKELKTMEPIEDVDAKINTF